MEWVGLVASGFSSFLVLSPCLRRRSAVQSSANHPKSGKPFDPSGNTALTGAKLIFEIL